MLLVNEEVHLILVITSRATRDAAVVAGVEQAEWDGGARIDGDSFLDEQLSGDLGSFGDLEVVGQPTFSRRAELSSEDGLVMSADGGRHPQNVWVSVHGKLIWIKRIIKKAGGAT